MKNSMLVIVSLVGGLMLSGGFARGQGKPADCPKADAPEVVEGQVTQVDVSQGKLTLRATDGTMHEFQASGETIKGYKGGDPIKARLRRDPRCE